jgi:hypothetical protein
MSDLRHTSSTSLPEFESLLVMIYQYCRQLGQILSFLQTESELRLPLRIHAKVMHNAAELMPSGRLCMNRIGPTPTHWMMESDCNKGLQHGTLRPHDLFRKHRVMPVSCANVQLDEDQGAPCPSAAYCLRQSICGGVGNA